MRERQFDAAEKLYLAALTKATEPATRKAAETGLKNLPPKPKPKPVPKPAPKPKPVPPSEPGPPTRPAPRAPGT